MIEDRPPSTVKECIEHLIYVIESSSQLEIVEEKACLLDLIREELTAYLKLKEFIEK